MTGDGTVLGSLPPFPVETPWWQDVGPVVRAAREHRGVDVTILRLLETEPGGWNGGLVTYLAEVSEAVPAEPWAGTLTEHQKRLGYARPGGPAADVAWAVSALDRKGLRLSRRPEQVRSWNLSSLWRLPTVGQTAWLKVVPSFFAHEGAAIKALTGHPVPRLLAHEGPRLLLAEIPGEDLYNADLDARLKMLRALIAIQADCVGRVDELLALGLPDWRGPALTEKIASVLASTMAELSAEDRATLDGFVKGLPRQFAELAACGLPDTLVHGDFHSGNVRGDGTTITILDWGDCGIGHPLLDRPAFLEDQPEEWVDSLTALWAEQWRARYPASDPLLASRLIAPIAAARQAVIYRAFLDNIEPSEHVYHANDPRDWLQRTAELVRDGRS